jgi:hypothetical protein
METPVRNPLVSAASAAAATSFVAESVVRAGVDGSRGDGIDPDRGQLDRQPGDDGVDGGVGGSDREHARGWLQRGGT